MSGARNLLLLTATVAASAAVVVLGLSGGPAGPPPTSSPIAGPTTSSAERGPAEPRPADAHLETPAVSGASDGPDVAEPTHPRSAARPSPSTSAGAPAAQDQDRAPPSSRQPVPRPATPLAGGQPARERFPGTPRAPASGERADREEARERTDVAAAPAEAAPAQDPPGEAPELAPATTGIVRGVVRDDAGRPLNGVLVSLGPAGSTVGASTVSARSDAGGAFRFDVPPGIWSLTAFAGRERAVRSEPFALEVGQELVVALPPLPSTRWRVALVAPDGAPLPNASGRLRFADGLELRGALRGDRLELSLGDAPEPALPAEALLVVDSGDERLRRWAGRVEVTADPALASVTFAPRPVLELVCELAADEPSAALRVETLQDEPLATRTGLGLRPPEDADPDALLWSTGAIVSSEPQEDDDAWPVRRMVRVRVGLDVALPTTVRVRLEPRRARTHGEPVVVPAPRVLELVLDAPHVEARLPLE